MKGFVPARSVVIPGSYTKNPAGDFQVPCAINHWKTSNNATGGEFI
jgi:hypothetical protein